MTFKPVLLAAALSAAVLVAGASAQATASATAATDLKTTKVTVTAGEPSEMAFTLSRTSVPRGTVVFRIVNKGETAHDFKINGKKTADVQPGGSAVLKVTFKKKGSFGYLCTVPGHAAAGMKGVLVVK